MRSIIALLVLGLVILLGGCWDSVEIEDEYLVMAMGWERAEDPQKMILSCYSPTTAEGAVEQASFVSVSAYSVESGIQEAQEITYRTVELGHLRVLLIGDEFARAGIEKHMDSIGRNPRIGRETLIVVTPEPLKSVLEMKNDATPWMADYIVDMIKANKKIDLALDSTFRDFFEGLSQEGREPVTAFLRLTEDKKNLHSNGAAVFYEDKMVGTLIGKELEALVLLLGKGNAGSITLGQATAGPEEQSTTFKYRRANTKVKTKVIDDEPYVYVTITLEGDITEYTSSEPTNDEAVIAKIEEAISAVEEESIKKTVAKCQKEYRSDVFGFGQYFRAYHNWWWNTHSWKEEFPTAKVHIEVVIDVRRIGIES